MSAFFRKNFFILLSVLVFSLFAGFHVIFAQSTDLVSQWDGDAVSGRTALDVGNGNNGTLSGGVSIVPGKVGNAFNLNGYIRIGNPANLNFGTTEPFSLEVWFNWNARNVRSGYFSANNIIRKSNYPVEGPGAGYWLRIMPGDKPGANGELEFFVGETVGIPDQPRGKIVTPVSPQTWYHVIATRDSSGTMKLYVDGELKGAAEAPNANTTSETAFNIGVWGDRFGNEEFFYGLIDEVSVYSRALDSSEVEALYNGVEDDIELYRAMEPYIKSGETPGQCTTVRGCRAYCDLEENFDECFDFAVKAGLIEIEDPYLLALQSGEAPGGCIGEDACAEYCGEASHIRECVAFFARFDVFSPDVLQILYDLIAACEQAPDFVACIESASAEPDQPVDPGTGIQVGVVASQAAQTIQDAIQRGESPGKCTDEVSCRKYCENIDNIQECLVFVEKFNLATPDELREMRQIAAAKQAGVPFPGNCKTKQSCLQYCEAPSHAVECVNFAEAAGFISGDEAAQARKFAPLVARGETPGGCTRKAQCEAYCEDTTHIDECLDFVIKYDVLPPDELEIVKKIQPFVKAGKMPGGCKTKAQCEAYCENSDHVTECIDIGLALGIIKPEEVEMIKKSGGRGPGNCRSKEACEAFCSEPQNQRECTDFAVKIGLITEEEAAQAQAAGDVRQCFEEADEKITACFVTNLGVDVFEQMKAGKMPYDIAIIERMRKAKACVSQYSDQATDVLEDFLEALPAANSCVATEFGPDFMGRLRKGTVPCSQMKGIKEKMNACFAEGTNALFEPCAQKECDQVQSCMADVSKSLAGIAKQVDAGTPAKPQKQELPPVLQDKINSCGINLDPLACVSKSTCKEFFSCLGPSGSETDVASSGDTPPELLERMNSCQNELLETKMRECTDKPTCSEVTACLKEQQSGDTQTTTGETVELPADIQSRLTACQQEENQAKTDACLALSCSEFDACIKSLQQAGGDQGQEGQGSEDPRVKAKVQACQEEKINACLAKPCSEFFACLNSLGGDGGGDGGSPNPAVQAKVESCTPKSEGQ